MREIITVPSCSPLSHGALTHLLEERTGQQLAGYRAWRIDTALKPVVRDRGLDSIDQLADAVRRDRVLADEVVDALLNGETSFFRDGTLIDQVVDAAAAIAATGRRPRIWSAGCSTGQESLSLAMACAERRELDGTVVPDIVATDVSAAAIARAREGRYSHFEIQRGLPIRRMLRWFEEAGEEWKARPELIAAVAFRRHNLVAEAPPGRFDIVLCRNVLLYLGPDTKARVFAHLADALRPDGLLVLGAGETVIGQTDRFEPSLKLRGFYAHARPRTPSIAA
jgi:chemotaxis protein methyltransferase CheR